MSNRRHPATLLAQADHYIDAATGGVIPPIQPSTTYARDEDYALVGEYSYSRYQNPTYDQVERLAAELDGGAEARVFASGLSSIAVSGLEKSPSWWARLSAARLRTTGDQLERRSSSSSSLMWS